MLPPLDAPHHARAHEWTEFREGVVVEGEGEGMGKRDGEREEGGGEGQTAAAMGGRSRVNVGLQEVRDGQ